MRTSRRTRDVLGDKAGLSTSIIDTLAGVSIKMITTVMVGGLLATLLVFWAVATASADTSSGFQTSNIKFEQSVTASNVVVGRDAKRVGLLTDTADGQCKVETWQSGTRDGETTLRVDTSTVPGVCTPTTPLVAAGAGTIAMESLSGIEPPVFTYENIGGREITFDASGTPTLVTGAKPADVKVADWDDVRPYKVTLNVEKQDEDTAEVTKKAVLTAHTNVINVTAAEDDLRFVPSPSTDPIPGPIRITGVQRSATTGTVYSGTREGIAVTFAGGVCVSGTTSIPTKVSVSYTQQGPSARPVVNTVFNGVLTGTATNTVHLGSVANGSSGIVEISGTCIDGGAAEKASTGYTQDIPATTLSIAQNAAAEKHDLSWTPVSSLPTSFELRWTVGAKNNELLTTTPGLAYQSVNAVGANLGLTTTYTIVATIDSNDSPVATGNITNPLPQAPASTVTSSATGATWTVIACTPGATAQYASRYYQQTGTSTAVSWTPLSAWGTNLSLAGVTTPAYGRTVAEVQTRCVANVSGVISPVNTSNNDSFYVPEAVNVSGARSATTGAVYIAREGMTATHTGARCYNGTQTRIDISWQPQTPAGQTNVNSSRTIVPTGGAQTVELANVKNGASGNLVAAATCVAGKSGSATDTSAFTQTIPTPVLNVTDGASADQHQLTWGAVSSLTTSFEVRRKVGAAAEALVTTTPALTYTSTVPAGSNLGSTTNFSVTAVIGVNRSAAGTDSVYTAVPQPFATVVTSNATGATWTAVTCVTGATAQYASRYYQQVGTSTAVAWTPTSAFSTSRTLSGVTTPAYGRTVTEAHTRCVGNVSGVASPINISAPDLFYAPEATTLTAARSTTTGTVYSGAREGLRATHSGARCYNGTSSRLDIAWEPATPAGQVDVNAATRTAVLPGTSESVELSNVRNGAQGNLVATVTCTAGKSSTTTRSVAYTQPVPNPVLTATEVNANQHKLDWTAVSSLPTTFQVAKTAAVGTQNATPAATTALTQTLTYTAGTNYGNKTDYTVTATVNGDTGTSVADSITAAWPTTPLAHLMTYTRTGYNGNHSSGTLNWSYFGSCAVGTSMKDRLHENREGLSNGTYNTAVQYTSAWFDDRTSTNWGPAYAKQGYSYSVLIDVKCVSDITGLESPIGSLQQTYFITPMTTPATSVWNGANFHDWIRPASRTYHTGVTGPASITIDWTTYCPTGSWVNWSNYESTSWAGSKWTHAYGFDDNWGLPAGDTARNVTYGEAQYSCATAWVVSARSAMAPTKTISVQRQWW